MKAEIEVLNLGDHVEIRKKGSKGEELPIGATGIIRQMGKHHGYVGIEFIDRKGFTGGHNLRGLLKTKDGWNVAVYNIKVIKKTPMKLTLLMNKELR